MYIPYFIYKLKLFLKKRYKYGYVCMTFYNKTVGIFYTIWHVICMDISQLIIKIIK